jgi:membrane fusion protein, multidrug efflux system
MRLGQLLNSPRLILLGGTAVALAAGLLVWRAQPRPDLHAPGPVAISVRAITAELKNVPVYVRGLGTVQAYNTVNVRTRVDGQITKVLFTEGQEVQAGDPLFQVDPRPFQAALDQAQAAKQRDEAQLEGAQLDLERYAKLLPSGWQSRQSYENQQAIVGQLRGTIKADQAQIDTAQLNLEYAMVRAPIAGRTGSRLLDVGNFVQAGQNTTLVVITQIKPLFVNFAVTQDLLDRIRREQAKAPLEVLAYSNDDKTKLAQGTLTVINNQVEAATGTVAMKASFENTDERLWPGELVNARLMVAMQERVVTVPAGAVMEGSNGSYVYVIKPDNRVEQRAVRVALSEGELAVIANGVSVGDSVVVDGQSRLTDGANVRTSDTNSKRASAQP